MTAVLLGGQHAHEHYEIDGEEFDQPPQYIQVQTRGGGGPYGRKAQVSVYQHTGTQDSAGTQVYQFARTKFGVIDGFVEFSNSV